VGVPATKFAGIGKNAGRRASGLFDPGAGRPRREAERAVDFGAHILSSTARFASAVATSRHRKGMRRGAQIDR